jgi:VanZ family protein
MIQLILFCKPFSKYLLVFWTISIVIISSLPSLPTPKIDTGRLEIRLDYIFHFFEYGLLTLLAYLSFVRKDFNINLKKYFLITLTLIIFSIADEFHQKLIPGRSFNLKDIISNFSGIVTAFLFCYFIFRKIAVEYKKL